jgi:hypothetical protein
MGNGGKKNCGEKREKMISAQRVGRNPLLLVWILTLTLTLTDRLIGYPRVVVRCRCDAMSVRCEMGLMDERGDE